MRVKRSAQYVEQISGLEHGGRLIFRILAFPESLHLPGLNFRHDQIIEAHHKTCLWAYNSVFTEWDEIQRASVLGETFILPL